MFRFGYGYCQTQPANNPTFNQLIRFQLFFVWKSLARRSYQNSLINSDNKGNRLANGTKNDYCFSKICIALLQPPVGFFAYTVIHHIQPFD